MARDDHLFSRADWFSVAENQKNGLQQEVASYDDNRLLNTSVEDLTNYFADKFGVEVPVLDQNAIVADQRETQVDVGNDFRYASLNGGPHYVPGTAVEITIPFTGEAKAFGIRPTTGVSNPPRAKVHGSTLVLEITGIDMSPERLRSDIEEVIGSIESYLTYLRTNADELNATLPGIARSAIEARRKKLLSNQNLISSLGFALKENPSSPQTYRGTERPTQARSGPAGCQFGTVSPGAVPSRA